MNLSKNFTLEEMTATSSHFPNVPSDEEIANLTELVQHVLQPLRDKFDKPIHVDSGYRSLAVNKEKGGSLKPISQHCKGEAADLITADNATIFHLIRFFFDYDQLIWEGGNEKQPLWVHVSYKTIGNRKQALKMVIMDGKKTYIEP